MNKKLNLLVSSAIIALTFSTPQAIQGTESLSTPNESKKPSGIQLKELADGSLEAILGSGNDILLKISMDLTSLKEPVEQECLEVPVQLFLTDFGSSPTSDTPVRLSINVDCEWTPLACVLPKKPASFDSYGQFTDWLNQGYFTNENRIAYDFDVDVQQLAPSLAQHLYAVAPGGYHFTGTYATHNERIIPDNCVPNIAYLSQRGSTNTTTVTLGGALYLNKKAYPVVECRQIFPHPMIEQKVFKRDQTKKFYHQRWLAQSQITAKATYEEFPGNRIKDWPQAPCQNYSVLRQKPGDIKEISHIACLDGINGEAVDISDDRIFLMNDEGFTEKSPEFLESIVADEKGKLFIMRYLYSTPKEESNLESLEEEAERLTERAKSAKEMEKLDLKNALAVARQNIADLKEQLDATQREVADLRQAREAELEQQRAAEERERQAAAERQTKEGAERKALEVAERERVQKEKAEEAERQRLIKQEYTDRRRSKEEAIREQKRQMAMKLMLKQHEESRRLMAMNGEMRISEINPATGQIERKLF
jgi:hypothetical protein